eukprot:102958-Chlamydomonas_euryale.AAC.1
MPGGCSECPAARAAVGMAAMSQVLHTQLPSLPHTSITPVVPHLPCGCPMPCLPGLAVTWHTAAASEVLPGYGNGLDVSPGVGIAVGLLALVAWVAWLALYGAKVYLYPRKAGDARVWKRGRASGVEVWSWKR